MKKAEVWSSEFFHENGLPIVTPDRIRKIQADAIKDAAEVGYKAATVNVNPLSTSTAVLLVLSTAGIAKKAVLELTP